VSGWEKGKLQRGKPPEGKKKGREIGHRDRDEKEEVIFGRGCN